MNLLATVSVLLSVLHLVNRMRMLARFCWLRMGLLSIEGMAVLVERCDEVLIDDISYWNSAYKPDEYNFVQYAIQRGYSVFFYDRLGVGSSTKYAPNSKRARRQIAELP